MSYRGESKGIFIREYDYLGMWSAYNLMLAANTETDRHLHLCKLHDLPIKVPPGKADTDR
jgi:hypothetical protein